MGWIEEYLGDGVKIRQGEWTRSIAVGSGPFIENVKVLLGFRAKGRDVVERVRGISSGRELLTIRLFSRLKTRI